MPDVETEVCNGLDDDCNGTPDNGAPNVLCPPTANVTVTSCSSGSCTIVNCGANRYNADTNYGNGCECEDLEQGSTNSCSAGSNDLNLSLGAMGTLPGVIIDGADSDWYQVQVPAGVTSGIEITFGSNPGNVLRLEVDQGGCTSNPYCSPSDGIQRLTRNNCSGNQRPNDPSTGITNGCANGTGGNFAGNAITDAQIFYIRVYRGTGTSTCVPYVVNVRAGAAS